MTRLAVLTSFVMLTALSACNKATPPATNAAETSSGIIVSQARPPAGGSWADVANATSAGGYVMGNPNAPVKLVEIGSLSCPHCRAFKEEGAPALIANYVNPGKVSWEFRPYLIHGPIDVAADLIARCNGVKGFFPLMQAMYKDQPVWMGRLEGTPQAKLDEIQKMPPNQAFVAMADVLGLRDWAAARGVPHASSTRCLSDQKMIAQEVQVTSDVNSQYPDFSGTPAFIVNGKLLPKEVVGWDLLEPALKDTLK